MRWRAAGDGEKNEDGGSEWGVEEDRVRGRFICTSMRVGARCAGRMHTEEETEQNKQRRRGIREEWGVAYGKEWEWGSNSRKR